MLLAERACASAGECRWDLGAIVSGVALSRNYKNNKKVENDLKGQKTSILTVLDPFFAVFFGEKAPPQPLCQHQRPRGPGTCSGTPTHKYYYSTLVGPSTLWCVKNKKIFRGSGGAFGGGQGALLGGGSGGAFEVLRNIGIRRFLYYMAESVPAGWDPPTHTVNRAPRAQRKKSAEMGQKPQGLPGIGPGSCKSGNCQL